MQTAIEARTLQQKIEMQALYQQISDNGRAQANQSAEDRMRRPIADVQKLVANGTKYVVEGANMPTTLEATNYLIENGVFFAPGKAANAGGVAVSGLEMSQNAEHLSWTFEEVDSKLQGIMESIYTAASEGAATYGHPGNLVFGANIAGFLKVANAMMAQGIC